MHVYVLIYLNYTVGNNYRAITEQSLFEVARLSLSLLPLTPLPMYTGYGPY